MKSPHVYAVIMAGGSGERFWPVSRTSIPKQLLAIIGKETMIQDAVKRVLPLAGKERVLVVTNREQSALVKKQLPYLNPKNIIAEPVGRDTAPCIALAAAILQKMDPEAIMVVMPADHVIKDNAKFLSILRDAVSLCTDQSCLVTIGIKPTSPHTGYGYIKLGGPIDSGTKTVFKSVEKFEEKPDIEKARRFVAAGDYFWNSGMFVWKTSAILSEIKENMPALYGAALKMADAYGKTGFEKSIEKIYKKLEKISIDYGVMEKARDVVSTEGDFYWDDLGSWSSLGKYRDKDENGNISEGETALLDVKDSLLISKDGIIAAIGVSNLAVIKTTDAVLVCDKSRLEEIKNLVRRLKVNNKFAKYT